MPITPLQMRAGRLLAGLRLRDLATMTGLSSTTLHAIENGRTRNPRAKTLETVRAALESCGVQFTAHGWLRHRDDSIDPDGD